MFKRSQLTKIQKEQQKKREREENRVNERVNNEVFPLLKEISADVDDAIVIISVLDQVIQQAMVNLREKTTVKDLNLVDLMNDNTEKTEKYKKLLSLIEDESIKNAMSILGGLAQEIQLKQRLFWKNKSLTELYAEESTS